MTHASVRLFCAAIAVTALASPARAQDQDDAVLQLAQPDFTLVALPTSLRLPHFASAFRVTHRFTRPLNCDTCGSSLLSDFFGLDSGAQIGLEYRFGIVPHGQIGIHRTSDKTIQFFGQYGVVRQDAHLPVDISVLLSVDGTNNFRDEYSPAFGAILSRTLRDVGAVYVEPIYVHHSNVFEPAVADNNTFMLGLGLRLRVTATTYLVGEVTPRVAGYRPGNHQGSFGIEKRVGGHMFQLDFSNAFGTTMGQIARGGSGGNNWYMGFNITRKFF